MARPQGYDAIREIAGNSLDRVEEDQPLLPDNGGNGRRSKGCNWGSWFYYSCLTIVVLAGVVSLLFNMLGGGGGGIPIASDTGVPFVTAAHPLRPTALWGAVKPPYPTGAWFTNLVIGAGDQPVVPLPYAVRAGAHGIDVSFSAVRRQASRRRITDVFDADLTVGAAEGYLGHALTRYDNLSASVSHELRGGAAFATHLVRGSPYMTFEYKDATPTLATATSILALDGKPLKEGATVRGKTFKLGLSNWETWMVYTSESVSFKVEARSFTALMPMSGMLRAALLPRAGDAEAEFELNEHAYAYAKGGEIQFDVDGDTLVTKFVWEKYGFGDLLMLALPHHIDMMDMETTEVAMPKAYQTLKGRMTGVVGTSWEMREELTAVGWGTGGLAGGWGADRADEIRAELVKDISTEHPTAADIYGFSKQSARMARLALIAEELGEMGYRDQAVSVIEDAMAAWLRNDNSDLLVYDKTWGGVVTYDGLNDAAADFGNGWYNDHHFHYGYFLYAAAVVAKNRPGFYPAYRRQLDFMVSDIACHRALADRFPTARHKDFFDGHSWASGLFSQGNGKSQESSSEAVNAYYAVYLLGMATGNKELRDWGRILLAGELRSTDKYWHMRNDSDVYDSIFASNRMVGVVGGLDAVDVTWFGDNVEYVHGINMMPFTPISAELLPYGYMREEWPMLATALTREDPPLVAQWEGYIHLAHAILDPEAAWSGISDLTVFDAANSKTNSLHWVASRPAPPPGYNETLYADMNAAAAVTVPVSCLENSACFAQGLTLQCCPTDNGTWLGCCPSITTSNPAAAYCSATPACAAQGLGGDDPRAECCPTAAGIYLGCCDVTHPTVDADSPAACGNNPGCEGLEGNCCPTTAGDYLGCCGAEAAAGPAAVTGAGGGAACSAHAACAGLMGDCCPTTAGDMLGCCGGAAKPAASAPDAAAKTKSTAKPKATHKATAAAAAVTSSSTAEASAAPVDQTAGALQMERACGAHAACAGLEGDCCPTAIGDMLLCCS